MENNEAEIKKQKTKKVILFGFGTLVLGTLAFFGIKHFTKPKNEENNDTTDQTTDDVDSDPPAKAPVYTKPRTGLPSSNAGSPFPLRLGSKGDKVRLLQQSLIRTYGDKILAKYGADGGFGNELATALRSKGYGVPLQEADFLKITAEKKEQTPQTPKPTAPLLTFDPAAIAKGIYYALTIKDFNAALTLLKSIKNTTDYSLVSEQLKNYRIAGVRQTLVNGMLTTFTESSQKLKVQDTLKTIGLKYDGKKWSLT